MERLQRFYKYEDWITPLHEIAMEQTGLSNFGDSSYLVGLERILDSLDRDCDLNGSGKQVAPLKLVHVLKQRLLTEQAFAQNPALSEISIEKPLLITGLVRTGSTALHYLMAKDPSRQHLEYWLAEHPKPRPPCKNWSADPDFITSQGNIDLMFNAAPELKAIHFMAADWPEECGHLMAQTFTDDYWQCTRRNPQYNDWYEQADLEPTYRQHKRLLQLIGSNAPDKPWLLKYPVHMKHLKSFLTVYPDAQVIWTHRDPSAVLSSYVSLIEGFRSLSVEPDTLDRNDILTEQMEIWGNATERAMAVRDQFPETQFYDLHFNDFMQDSVEQVKKVYAYFGLEFGPNCEQAMQQWCDENPQNKHGQHIHSRDTLSISKEQMLERFDTYIKRFGVRIN